MTSLEQPLVTVPTYQWTPGHSESEFVMRIRTPSTGAGGSMD